MQDEMTTPTEDTNEDAINTPSSEDPMVEGESDDKPEGTDEDAA